MTEQTSPIAPDYSMPKQALHRVKEVIKRRLGSPIEVEPLTEPYLVVAVLGQSNAHGAGDGLDRNSLDAPHPRVHQYASSGPKKDTIVSGADPLFHELPSKAVGFGSTFAKNMADATGRGVLLVPYSRGDSSFVRKNGVSWDPADTGARINLFWGAVDRIEKALALNPDNELAAILWHQGESDVPLMTGPDYALKLDSSIDTLRTRFGSDVPFILGGMVPEEMDAGDPNYKVIDAVHANTPVRRVKTAFVPGIQGAYNEGVMIHYNAVGQRRMGADMWQAYQKLVETTK